MNLNLLTLATIKTQLGLSVSTYDTQITAMIPIVSSDVRRILNNNFDYEMIAYYSDSADTISVIYRHNPLTLGTVIQGDYIPDDTYITGYNPLTGSYDISATPTGDGTYIYPTISIAQWPTISKMIWFRISQLNTTSATAEKLTSVSYGPVSKSFADSEINRRWNYPQALIDDLGPAMTKVG